MIFHPIFDQFNRPISTKSKFILKILLSTNHQTHNKNCISSHSKRCPFDQLKARSSTRVEFWISAKVEKQISPHILNDCLEIIISLATYGMLRWPYNYQFYNFQLRNKTKFLFTYLYNSFTKKYSHSVYSNTVSCLLIF